MKTLNCFYLVALTTTFIYEAIDARPFMQGFDMGIPSMISSWLSENAPGKAGNEGQFHLPAKSGPQPMVMPMGGNGMMNNKQLSGFGQQALGPGGGRMLPNAGQGMGPMGPIGSNNQFGGAQRPMELGVYKGPALTRAGRR